MSAVSIGPAAPAPVKTQLDLLGFEPRPLVLVDRLEEAAGTSTLRHAVSFHEASGCAGRLAVRLHVRISEYQLVCRKIEVCFCFLRSSLLTPRNV